MDKDWLAKRHDDGASIEAISRVVRRHPSTVSWWVDTHGLRSEHVDEAGGRVAKTTQSQAVLGGGG